MNTVESFPAPKKVPRMNHSGETYLGTAHGIDFYLAICTMTHMLTIRFEEVGKRYDIGINKEILHGLHHAYEVLYEFDRRDY